MIDNDIAVSMSMYFPDRAIKVLVTMTVNDSDMTTCLCGHVENEAGLLLQ